MNGAQVYTYSRKWLKEIFLDFRFARTMNDMSRSKFKTAIVTNLL